MTFVTVRRARGAACDVIHAEHGAWHVPAGPCEELVPEWVVSALPADELSIEPPSGTRPARTTAVKETDDAA